MRLRARTATVGAVLVTALAVTVPVTLAGPAHAAGPLAAAGVPAAPTGLALQEGDRGRLVAKLQRRLGGLPTTGYFGSQTRAAVTAFQESQGLEPTGIVDDATWAAIRAAARQRAADATPAPVDAASAPAPAADPAAADLTQQGGEPAEAADAAPDTEALRAQIIAMAESLKGIPYVAGGTTPASGFDCSGFTSYVFRKAIGMTIPRVSRDQYAFSTHITRAEAKPGDLVFFHTGSGWVYHVSIYAGNGKIWHSPRTGESVTKAPIWSSAVYFGRVL